MTISETIDRAVTAKAQAARLTAEQKNAALFAMADSLLAHSDMILEANEYDVEEAAGAISPVMLDRLRLTEKRIFDMAAGLKAVAALPDPTGKVKAEFKREDGLEIKKVSVPLGVVAIIYESRPNVTADAAALCLKSGNACILRTGKEAHRSALAIVEAMRSALYEMDIDPDIIGFAEDVSRESATALMRAKGKVDLLIPRGGAGLIRACVENATVPCIETGTGICHVYVHAKADYEKALKIIENAKCSRPSVCNAAEVCLVDGEIAASFLPLLYKKLVTDRPQNKVELLLDESARNILGPLPNCISAGEGDFDTEFLDYKLAVKVVDGVDGAIAHVAAHSTGHSESIITEDGAAADRFTASVDSAAVYVNASTRFTDGGEFGLGCEMGISTQKLHARGPMGLEELTSYKYVIRGNGHVR